MNQRRFAAIEWGWRRELILAGDFDRVYVVVSKRESLLLVGQTQRSQFEVGGSRLVARATPW